MVNDYYSNTEKLRQEDQEFKVSLNYKVIPGQTGRGIRGKSRQGGMEGSSEVRGKEEEREDSTCTKGERDSSDAFQRATSPLKVTHFPISISE